VSLGTSHEGSKAMRRGG